MILDCRKLKTKLDYFCSLIDFELDKNKSHVANVKGFQASLIRVYSCYYKQNYQVKQCLSLKIKIKKWKF